MRGGCWGHPSTSQEGKRHDPIDCLPTHLRAVITEVAVCTRGLSVGHEVLRQMVA